jgi:hypothetical protein
LVRLLRACGERPSSRGAAENYDELASPHAPSHQPEDTLYHILIWSCAASQQTYPTDVCCGSKADMTLSIRDVRFAPESGHSPVAI